MREAEEGIGCRPAAEALLLFGGLFLLGSLLFFSADPEAVPFWRLWLFSSFAPVSGVAMALGAPGLAWTLDVGFWALVAVWVGRSVSVPSRRRRIGLVLGLALVVGLVAATAR